LPEPEPYVEPEPVYPQPAPIVVGSSLALASADADFTLTPAPEITVENSPQDALRADLPEAANESGPGLFDVTLAEMTFEGAPVRPLMSEDHVRRLVQQDEMAAMSEFDQAFAETPVEPARIAGLPVIVMGLSGIILFAGGIAWALSTASDGGLMSAQSLGYVLALVGAGLFGGATYIVLSKFLGGDYDAEDEEVTEAESQPGQ